MMHPARGKRNAHGKEGDTVREESGAAHAAKAALRARVLGARAALSAADRLAASAVIRDQLLALPGLASRKAVLGYAAFGSEVDLDAYLATLIARGVGVFLPWVEGEQLAVGRVRDLDADLAPGWRGVREPRASGRRPARPDRLHAAIVPGVAFDRSGNRLGYGGGHFDRLLGRLARDTLVVGVAYEAQLVARVPVEGHDRPVDVVVTEAGCYEGTSG
jgi:5-formyltetrahydrofolate cyclo-ligase